MLRMAHTQKAKVLQHNISGRHHHSIAVPNTVVVLSVIAVLSVVALMFFLHTDTAPSQANTKPSEPLTKGKVPASSKAVAAKQAASKRASLEEQLSNIFGNAQYSVDVISMEDLSTVVGVNVEEDFVSASTYKLYVAYSMLTAVENGTETWGSELNGTTLETCFTRMIVNSDNACPTAWFEKYSYSEVTDQAHEIGASSTTRLAYQDKHTTAEDLSKVLTEIYKGTILTDDSRSRLLTAMESQVYRSGIPAGIGSAGTVADKVGFLEGLLHDGA